MIINLTAFLYLFFGGFGLAFFTVVGASLWMLRDLGHKPSPVEPSADWYWLQARNADLEGSTMVLDPGEALTEEFPEPVERALRKMWAAAAPWVDEGPA